jgi:hypothetical protein
MSYYQNKCPTCPANECSGDYLKTQGKCDWTTQGECQYYGSTRCENGCDPATNTCIDATQTQNLCATKTCAIGTCNGNNLKTGGSCNSTNGECTFSNTTYCENGCDEVTLTCKPKIDLPKDPCENVTCKNSCTSTGGTNEASALLKYNGTCNSYLSGSGTDLCEYQTKTCSKCTKDGKDCLEICDNGKVDNVTENKLDCSNPACSNSPACKCLYTYDGINWNPIGEGTTPSGQVNIIIVGTGYGNVDETKRDETFFMEASSIITAFNKAEPFASNLNKIRFYTTRTNVYSGLQGLYSPQAQGMQKCNASSKDYFIILHGDSTNEGGEAQICGKKADIYKTTKLTNTEIGLYALHEFGHAFGCLWDEYDTAYDDFKSMLFSDMNAVREMQTYRKQLAIAKEKNDQAQIAKIQNLMKTKYDQIGTPGDIGLFRKTYQWMIHGTYYDATNCSTYTDITSGDCQNEFKSILAGRSWFTGTPTCYSGCTAPYWHKSTNENTIMRDVEDGGWDSFLAGGTPTFSPTARAYLESKLTGTKITRWAPTYVPYDPATTTGAGGAKPEEWAK